VENVAITLINIFMEEEEEEEKKKSEKNMTNLTTRAKLFPSRHDYLSLPHSCRSQRTIRPPNTNLLFFLGT
jgi:hypothetical protein